MSNIVERLRLKRRLDTVQRLVPDMVRPSLYPKCQVARTFWWAGITNFGDLITPFLFRKAGIAPLWKPAKSADVFGVGSILEIVPEGYAGIIWGSGKMHENEVTQLPNARVLGVRGELTKASLGLGDDVFLGDPGLLMSDYVGKGKRSFDLGVIPHFTHLDSPWVRKLAEDSEFRVRLIDVRNQPLNVTKQIASCEAILTTSLHGLIIADALGVPAVWALPEPVLAGADFKFRDYESVVDPEGELASRRVEISEMKNAKAVRVAVATPSVRAVQAAQADLRQGVVALHEALSPVKISPLQLPIEQYRA
ncbi:polysaccharide pyruvyl transferase family protein [Dermabacteraceae bacterium P13103]